MDIFFIRLGKAFGALRRDGLIRGGKRVVLAGFSLFRRVRPGDVLFVTGGAGDSARYRCHNVAEELERWGFRTAVTVQDNPFLPSYVDTFSIFIFHRILCTPAVGELIAQIKKQKKEIIFETDDLTYDAALFAKTDAYAQMNGLERKLYAHGLGGEILDDPYVKVATTTTSFLADTLREKGKRVFVVPNKLSEVDTVIAIRQLAEKQSRGDHRALRARDTSVILAYFSGSASHNRDFATITEPLVAVLEKYPETRLAIYGPLDLDMQYEPFKERIIRVPYTARKKHFANVANADINLAPLVIGDPFCESKSELKFFEAGIVGVPTVASATQTFREVITDGVDGFVATTPEEWTANLSRLIEDEALRESMGTKAYEKSVAKYTTEQADNQEYYEYLRSKIVGKGI